MKRLLSLPSQKEDNVEKMLNAAFIALFYLNDFGSRLRGFAKIRTIMSFLGALIFFSLSTHAVGAPSVQRSQWWRMRTDTLAQVKEDNSSKEWFHWVQDSVNENMRLSGEMAGEYESVFNDTLSDELLRDRKEALFYAAYLDHFLRSYAAEAYMKEASLRISEMIRGDIAKLFVSEDQNFIEEVYRLAVSERDIKNITYQHFCALHERRLETTKAGVTVKTEDAAEALAAYAAYMDNTQGYDFTAAGETAAYSQLCYRLGNLKKSADSVRALYGSAGGYDSRNFLFVRRTDLLQSDFLPAAQKQAYDVKLFYASAARLRSLYTPKMGGADDTVLIQEYNTALLASLRAIVDKYGSSQENTGEMHARAEKESRYMLCVSALKSADSEGALETIGDAYENAAAMRAYLLSLYEKSTAVPNGASDALNSKLYTETARHFRYISQSASPAEDLRLGLRGAHIREYNALRENESGQLSQSLAMLVQASRNHAALTADLSRRDKSTLDNNELLLAQSEINRLERIVDMQIAALEKLDLFEGFVRDYALVYGTIEKEIGERNLSEGARLSFGEGTLIPRIHDADIKKIEQQREARTFLKKMIADDIARIAALSDMYKKRNTPLSYFPDQGALYLKRVRIDKNGSAQIASWQMNELNYALIDKKAVELLKSRYERANYMHTETSMNPAGTHKISEYGLSFSIPEGWEQSESSEQKEGNCMNFENSLDGSMLMVGGYKPSLNESEIIDNWIRQQNLKVLKTGYSEQGSTVYLWKIASDGGNNVAKIIAIHKDGKIIMVAGRAPKERYPFFQKRIDALFNSIR